MTTQYKHPPTYLSADELADFVEHERRDDMSQALETCIKYARQYDHDPAADRYDEGYDDGKEAEAQDRQEEVERARLDIHDKAYEEGFAAGVLQGADIDQSAKEYMRGFDIGYQRGYAAHAKFLADEATKARAKEKENEAT